MDVGNRVEVLVVGAGAAGLLAATALTEAGLECALLERRLRDQWGSRWCVEIDQRTLRTGIVPTPQDGAVIHRGEGGAHVIAPSGGLAFKVEPHPVWLVRLWDYQEQLLAALERRGTRVVFGCTLAGFSQGDGGVSCRLTEAGRPHDVSCRLLVLATGLGGEHDGSFRTVTGASCEVAARDVMCARQELWATDPAALCRVTLPAPRDAEAFLMGAEGPLSVGSLWVDGRGQLVSFLSGTMVCDGMRPPAVKLEELRTRYPIAARQISVGGAPIPVRRAHSVLAHHGVARIGHAACQVFPLTACGVGLAGHAARLLAEAAVEHCRGPRSEALWEYNCRYQRTWGAAQAGAEAFARWVRGTGPGVEVVDRLLSAGLAAPADYLRSLHLEPPIPRWREALSRSGAVLREARRLPGLAGLGLRVAAVTALYRHSYPRRPDLRAAAHFDAQVRSLLQVPA